MAIKLTLIQGDCMKVLPKIPDRSIDLILTSPPFLDKEVQGDYYTFLDRFLSEAKRISKVILMFNSSRRLVEICKRYSEDIAHVLIWNKVFTKTAFKYEPIFVMTEDKIFGRGRIYRDVLSYKVPINNKRHINENPVELYVELLKFFREAKTVLDPFLGSGTTMQACLEENRNCIGIERNPRYIETTKKRLNWGYSLADVEFKFRIE